MSAPARQETVEWIHRAQNGDPQANEHLIQQNIPLVKSIVKRFLGRGLDYDDLFQLGCMGLYKAVQHFDSTLDTQFSTYAVPLIMGEIRRHFRDDGAIKVSRSLKQLAARAHRLMDELRLAKGIEPSVEQLAEQLGVAAGELLMALDAMRPVASLDAPVKEGEDSGGLYALLGDDQDASVTVEMGDLIARLDEREKQVVLLRYYRGATQSEIAQQMGLSQAQVSRIEGRALSHLRESAMG